MKPRELPDTVYIPDTENWSPKTRDELFRILWKLQAGRCPVCLQMLDYSRLMDVHECIVTKGDVQSWPDSWKFLINNVYNCIVPHRECHRHGDRERWWGYKCIMFGKEEMEKWYYNLPFRGKIRRFE